MIGGSFYPYCAHPANLQDSSEEELNYSISNVKLPLLLHKVKDEDVMAPRKTARNNRTQVLELLCMTRLPQLEVCGVVCSLSFLLF
jgi:hypothetical protein